MSDAHVVRTTDGGAYIDGIPMLKWGEWKDSSYCGCVTALFNAAGIPVSYEEVMGLSGVCYQAIMREDWDPSSQMPQNGVLCEKNVGDALGVAVYTLGADENVSDHARESIDAGFPVLLVGGRWEPEWTLACGYAAEGGETRFFGRTYFDYLGSVVAGGEADRASAGVPVDEVYTANGYFRFSGFPGWFPQALTRFYDRMCEPISRREALRVSLQTCIRMFEQPPGSHHRFGYDCYDVLIGGLSLDDAEYKARIRNDQYHIGSLQDARRAAWLYLDTSADLLGGGNGERLTEAAGVYRAMVENLLAAVPYENTTSVFNGSADPAWSVEQRRRLVEALKTNKELERRARVIVQGILDDWTD